MGVPVDLGACIVQGLRGDPVRYGLRGTGSFGAIRAQKDKVFRDRSEPLVLPEIIVYEIYRFSSEGIRYLIVLVGSYVGNAYCRQSVSGREW